MTSDKDMEQIQIRNKAVEDLKFRITEIFNKNKSGNFNSDLGDFDFMVDEIQQLITKTNIKLFTNELRSIANIYFCIEKSKDRTVQTKRLDDSNRLFQEIDHTNSMIIETEDSTIGLFYAKHKLSNYQCDEWQKLILKSIDDLDDRVIRLQILQHPFSCNHPTCIEVAKHMRGILK
ncbi:MAG: hypothetical protein QQN45_07605 [Nitrosopumilus sp.]